MSNNNLSSALIDSGNPFASAEQWISMHSGAVLGVLVILTILVLWMWMHKEKFNPTSTLRFQAGDTIGVGRSEFMTDGRGGSVFAQTTQSASGIPLVAGNPNAAANQPGSLSWNVLHDKSFGCDSRAPGSNDDAWTWQNGVAHESFTDNEFSKIAAGLA